MGFLCCRDRFFADLLLYLQQDGCPEPPDRGMDLLHLCLALLFVIDGIVSFMLTPGRWVETKSFWDGFFQSFLWPSLFFRTFIALSLAGIYGLITSTRIQDDTLRQRMVRYCVLWLAVPFVLLVPSAWWYLGVIPPEAREVHQRSGPHVNTVRKAFLVLTPSFSWPAFSWPFDCPSPCSGFFLCSHDPGLSVPGFL